jgi:Pyruvate/2-oxoacid:ferredoxin oxidoreductase delta subunit
MFCGLTCSSKIMFGAIPGTEKAKYHTRFPDPVVFSKMLLDLTDSCKVDLFLVDGIVGMDGNGPARGNPRKTGVIISGTDHIGIDLHVCTMTGLDPESIPVMAAARDLDLIKFHKTLTLTGSGSKTVVDPPFKPPEGGGIIGNLPRPLKKLAVNLTTAKPLIDRRSCVGCGVCRDNCAGQAIIIQQGKARINYSRCIRCYCCHELCPHDAVALKSRDRKLLKKMVKIGRSLLPGR